MVKIENISFAYSKRAPLITDLSLQVKAGNIYGLLGKNGAGKTSLLKLISGLRCPQQGKINVMGYDPFKREADFNNNIFFLPEEIYVPSMKASMFLKLHSSFYTHFNRELFLNYLKEFDLDMSIHLGRVSFGQKKKFLLSFALAAGTPLVLFDEPTNGLDIPSKTVFRKLAASAITEDRCFIISTHQVRDLNLLLDNVLILNKGQILLNNLIYELGRKYSFINLNRLRREGTVLYSEEHIEGLKAIVPHEEGVETGVDLELLFNAVVLGKINL